MGVKLHTDAAQGACTRHLVTFSSILVSQLRKNAPGLCVARFYRTLSLIVQISPKPKKQYYLTK